MSKNVKKLAHLTKNEEFINNFRAKLGTISMYKDDLMNLLEEAVTVRNKLDDLGSKLNFIFGDYFPDIILRNLADDLTPQDLPLQ